jgi:hypothetical protein
MSNKQLLERRKWAEKGRGREESDGKKDGQYAFFKIMAS